MTTRNLSDNREALKFLASLGVAKVTIEFDGGGDSGSLGEITFEGITEKPEALKPPELGGETLEKFANDLADRLLEETQYDWYNNDGGYGTITIVPGAEKPLHVDMNIRFMSSQLYELELDDDGCLVTTQTHEPEAD